MVICVPISRVITRLGKEVMYLAPIQRMAWEVCLALALKCDHALYTRVETEVSHLLATRLVGLALDQRALCIRQHDPHKIKGKDELHTLAGSSSWGWCPNGVLCIPISGVASRVEVVATYSCVLVLVEKGLHYGPLYRRQ